MKTIVTVYSYGGIPPKCLGSHLDFAADTVINSRQVMPCNIDGDALISRSRCRSTKLALDSGCDVWVQIDHDIQFTSDDLFGLAELALANDAAICVPYSGRGKPERAVVRPHPDHPITHVGINELVPVTFVASGFLAIPVSCVRETIEVCSKQDVPPEFLVQWCSDDHVSEFPTLWKPLVTETKPGKLEYLSEDYSASARMRLAGIPQLAWLKPQLFHWGDYAYTLPLSTSEIK